MGPSGPVGRLTESLGWAACPLPSGGLVVGSIVYSLPFAVEPQCVFESMGGAREVAAALGAGPLDRFFTVALPLARPGFITARR